MDSAPDATTAQAIAAQYDHPVLVDSETTEQSTVSALPDGTFQLSASNVPVRVKQDGDWVPVDTDLSRSGSWLEPAATVAPVRFSTGGSDVVDEVQAPSGEWISETWPHGPLPTPTIDGSTATYADVLPGVDLKLTATDVGMTSVYVVKSASAAANTDLDALGVDVEGADVTKTSSGMYSADTGEGAPLTGTSPVWWDSSHGGTFTEAGGDDPLRPVASTLSSDGVSMNVGLTTLQASVQYPLFVDPNWTPAANASWYTDKAYPNQSYLSASQSDVLRVGIYAQYQSDMFFQFSPPTSFSTTNTVVSSATLSTTQDSLDACPTNPIGVAVYGPKTAGFTWAQEQSYTGQWGSILETQTPGSCSNPSAHVIVPWDVATGVKAHLGSSSIQFGITSASSAQSRRHFERGATLTIIYDTRPNTPTGSAISVPARSCGTSASDAPPIHTGTDASLAGPTVKVVTTDPDGGPVQTIFTLSRVVGTTATLVATVTTPATPSGSTFSTNFPAFPQANYADGTYYWRAQGVDPTGNHSIGLTNPCWFSVDNTSPAAPTLAAVTTTASAIGEPFTVGVTPPADSTIAGTSTGSSTEVTRPRFRSPSRRTPRRPARPSTLGRPSAARLMAATRSWSRRSMGHRRCGW